MSIIINPQILKEYKRGKRNFSKMFRANESTIQKCSLELISIMKANGGALNPSLIIAYTDENPSADLNRIYAAYGLTTNEEKAPVLIQVLEQIPALIDEDNVVYIINKQS
jgi:hypothetical protein